MATDSSNALFSKLSRFVYGTTRLGHEDVPREDRLEIARHARDAGVWFHTSRQYGEALEVLGKVFDEDRSKVPPLIVKMGNDSVEQIREVIRANLEPLGMDHVEVGQLCLGGDYAESFASGGKACDELLSLKEEGLVKHFIYEVFPWNSQVPLAALRSGNASKLVDAYIFYFNPLQRFATNDLWNMIRDRDFPVIAMRTVCGAPVHALRDIPGAAWTPYLKDRAVEMAPIFERSGITSWTEFCVRFAFSYPQVKATVGSTSRADNLEAFLQYGLADTVDPLPDETITDIETLQYRWSDQVDKDAEPWTM